MKNFTSFRTRFFKKRPKIFGGGFALIETLVAITILIAGIAGPLSIAARSIAAAQEAEQQTTAFFLLVEGAEYLRQIRDTNNLSDVEWLSGLDACLTGTCDIDAFSGTVLDCSGSTCEPLSFEAPTGRYGHASGGEWQTSGFSRTITIREIAPDREIKASVTTAWTHRGVPRSITAEARLFNWQK